MSADGSIRAAVPADLAAMVRLQIATWREDYPWLGEAFFDDAFERHVADRLGGFIGQVEPWRRSLVLVNAAGALFGFVAFGSADRRPGEVFSLYIDRMQRGRGHGATLLARAWDELARRGRTPVQVSVLARNGRALHFYRRLGAVEFDRGSFELNGRTLDEITLVLHAKPARAG